MDKCSNSVCLTLTLTVHLVQSGAARTADPSSNFIHNMGADSEIEHSTTEKHTTKQTRETTTATAMNGIHNRRSLLTIS